jgi:hypothetical protein
MDEYSMTVVVQIDLACELTALTLTRMTSLTEILLAHFVTNIAFALSLNSHLQNKIERDGRFTAQFGFQNFHMVRSTLAHAQTNYHVSQFGH